MRVLIVEDSEIFRTVLQATIAGRFPEVTVLEAGAVKSGLSVAREQQPELVLVDIQLPDGSGMNLARQLVADLPESVVAICTSYDNPEYRAAAAACGVRHFIPKDEMSPGRVLGLVEATLPCGVC